jgi:hypothetical protein
MQCILKKIYFWKGFSYVLQIDMHLICTPILAKFYSCKKWVLHRSIPNTWRHLLSWGVYSYDSVLSRFEHDKPYHLMDSNRLYHSKPYSNHSIEPHHGHLTSRRMEDQHSQYPTSQTQHHKDGKTYTTLKTAWLSITNQV